MNDSRELHTIIVSIGSFAQEFSWSDGDRAVQTRRLCDTCHENNNFEADDENGVSLVCRKCGARHFYDTLAEEQYWQDLRSVECALGAVLREGMEVTEDAALETAIKARDASPPYKLTEWD